MKKITKKKFQPFKWIIFEMNNTPCIEYTYLEKNNKRVLFVSDELESNSIDYDKIKNPRILNIANQINMKIAKIANVKPEQIALWVKAEC